MEITATIDGKVKIVSKASIRRHLKLEDSDGISNLPATEIFEQLALMGQEFVVPQPRSPTQTNVADEAASTGVDVRYRGVATTVTSLDARQGSGNIDTTPSMPHDSPLPRVYILGSNEGRMQHNELMDLVTKLSDRVVALETNLQQTKKVYFYKAYKKVKKLEKTVKTRQARRKARIVVFDDEEDLEDPSKQRRKIAEIDQDLDISLVQHDAEVQGRHEHDMEPDFKFTTAEEVYTAEKEVSTAEPVSIAGALVSTTGASSAKDKGKAIMEEAEKWDNIQARVEADEEFAQRLQSEERKMYSEDEKASSKTQKTEESSEPAEEPKDKEEEELSQERIQQMMIIVPEQEMNVEALQTKCPIIDWEIYTEGARKEDLAKLWSLVKEKFTSTEPTEDKEREIWVELKRLFEPDTNDELWKLQKHIHDITWRLRVGISAKKEAPVNFLNDPSDGRSTLRSADVLVFEWVGGKYACVDLTGVSPLVGLNSRGFTGVRLL
ncbi:hypothetical protein Tco_0060367 [Tanacetum coccineum]